MPFIAGHLTALFRTSAPAIAAFFLLMGASAKADEIIYSNLGPGGSFSISPAWVIDQDPFLGAFVPAMSFTPSGDFTITTIDVAIASAVGRGGVVLELDSSDSNGILPGQVLESWNLENLPPYELGVVNAAEQVVSNTVVVQSGVQYWLVARPADPATQAVWNWNNQGDVQPFLDERGGSWFGVVGEPRGAFQVSGIPVGGGGNSVPEIDPSTASSALTILTGALLVIRGKKKVR